MPQFPCSVTGNDAHIVRGLLLNTAKKVLISVLEGLPSSASAHPVPNVFIALHSS